MRVVDADRAILGWAGARTAVESAANASISFESIEPRGPVLKQSGQRCYRLRPKSHMTSVSTTLSRMLVTIGK
jgi:hypothetical protein